MRIADRSCIVIAFGRLILASFFLVAASLGLDGLIAYPRAAWTISLGYTALSVLVIAFTWSNWWLEHRLRLPMHVVDIGFFLALNLAAGLQVANPFFLFFVFLVLSAAAKWGWRGAIWTSAAAIALFAASIATEAYFGPLTAEDQARAVIRGGHLVVLSVLLSWFGIAHLANRLDRSPSLPQEAGDDPPDNAAVAYLADCLDARRAMLIWTESEEPWLNIVSWSAEEGVRLERVGPADYPFLVAPELEGRTFLFDLVDRRVLVPREGRMRALGDCPALDEALARRIGLSEGVATPLHAQDCAGYLFATGIANLTWDDIAQARRAGTEIGHAFDRWRIAAATADSRESQVRLRVARDLHDSLAQVLAGVGLKLRAALTAPDEDQKNADLREIEGDLIAYQRQIYGYIEELRHPAGDSARIDLNGQLGTIVAALRRQWGIAVALKVDHLVSVPATLGTEVEYLLSEAVANAARHGRATEVTCSAWTSADHLTLRVEDNGHGFPIAGEFDDPALQAAGFGPRSIMERADHLGGAVELASGEKGAIVTIRIPMDADTK